MAGRNPLSVPSFLADEVREHAAVIAAVDAVLSVLTAVAEAICARLDRGGCIYTFGNGGSAADAQHLVAELVGRYARARPALRALALTTDPSVVTCIANDFGYEDVFARQVTAHADRDDVVVGFSTSGESMNVINGLAAGQAAGALTVLMTGDRGESAARHADWVLRAPSSVTPRIQETHTLFVHLVSEYIDRWVAGPAPLDSGRLR